VTTFLSQEWLDRLREASAVLRDTAEGSRPSGTIRHVVRGAPQGTVSYTIRLEEGRITEATLGDGAATDAADLNLTVSYDDAVLLARGDVSVAAAYMQGTLKVEGDMALLFDLLPCTHRHEFGDFIGKVASETEL
jgi:alkyl sulfatase BDS1-like metallo-beta-lactamase superfamily hydrolase